MFLGFWGPSIICISRSVQDLLSAMKMLGLNPMEQDIMDLCNTVPRNGLIYFPDFCAIVLKRWREEDEEVFRQNMFKVDSFCIFTFYID